MTYIDSFNRKLSIIFPYTFKSSEQIFLRLQMSMFYEFYPVSHLFSSQLLQDELKSEQGQYEQFIQKGLAILERSDPDSEDASVINKQIEEVNKGWDKLQGRLEERGSALADMLEQGTKFYENLEALNEWVMSTNDVIDGLASLTGSQPEVVSHQKGQLKVN